MTLPPGFCALVVHDGGIGEGRHILVNGNGDIYVITRRGPRPSPKEPFAPGGIVGLRDTNGDGKVDVVSEKFGTVGGTGLELRNGYLYYAAVDHIGRFKLTPGELRPMAQPRLSSRDSRSAAATQRKTSRSTTPATSM